MKNTKQQTQVNTAFEHGMSHTMENAEAVGKKVKAGVTVVASAIIVLTGTVYGVVSGFTKGLTS